MRLSDFLENFFLHDEIIYGRAIAAKKFKASTIPFSFTREQIASDRELQTNLKQWNKTRGIYFIVNAGGNSDAEISRINAAFCEIDDRPLEEQHDLFDNCPLPPAIRLETRKSVHAYWPLSEFITANEFTTLQRGLIKYFESDKGICNPARLMRLPFFNHVYFDGQSFDYKRVEIHTYRPDRFTYSEIYDAYPYEPPKVKPLPAWKKYKSNKDFESAHEELRRRIEATPNFHRQGHFGYTNGFCHGGKESDTALYINYATGYVECFAGCDFKQIANAFGVEFK